MSRNYNRNSNNGNKRKHKNSSLNYQLDQIMQNAKKNGIGSSKRAYRGQVGKSKTDRIHSHSSYNSIRSTSKALTKFMKENGIRFKKVEDIDKETIRAFLEYKAKTNNDLSLKKIMQHLESLALFISSYRKKEVDWSVSIPNSKKAYIEQDTKYRRYMTDEVFESILAYLEKGNQKDRELRILLQFCNITALRVDEIAHQKLEDIEFTGGDFGYGKINVSNPKHGRKRIVSIMNEEEQKIIKKLYYVSRNRGQKTITEIPYSTLKSSLTRAKKRANVMDAHLVGWHGIRKKRAQYYFDYLRKEMGLTKSDAIGFTNLMLGHGFDRGVSGLKTYVYNIY